MKRASRPPRRAATPGTGPHPRRWTPRWGPSRPVVPRDRAGTFTPRLVRKGQRRLDGLDAMIISLYAGGMTVRDIQHHLASTLSVELSAGTISKITDAVADAVARVAAPPAGGVLFPVIYHGRDPGQGPRQSPGRLPLGPYRGRGGAWTGSSTWLKDLGPGRGRSLLLGACVRRAGQQRRERRADRRGGTSRTGAKRAGECDGLTGLPEANVGSPGPRQRSRPAWST